MCLKEGTKNRDKMICPSCGNEMMKADKILHKDRDRYYFCPYCFTYSIVHKTEEKIISRIRG